MQKEVALEIARRLPEKKIFMIDDYDNLIQRINGLNDTRLTGILYDTPRFQTTGETWDTMQEALLRRSCSS